MNLFNKKIPYKEDYIKEIETEIRPHIVLVKVVPGYEYRVYKTIERIKEIDELQPLLGEYDFYVKFYINASCQEYDLAMFVIEKIRFIEGVWKTKTITRMDY